MSCDRRIKRWVAGSPKTRRHSLTFPCPKPPELVPFYLLFCQGGGRGRTALKTPGAASVPAFPKRIKKVRAWGTTSYQTWRTKQSYARNHASIRTARLTARSGLTPSAVNAASRWQLGWLSTSSKSSRRFCTSVLIALLSREMWHSQSLI
jgi:hypothetical protein